MWGRDKVATEHLARCEDIAPEDSHVHQLGALHRGRNPFDIPDGLHTTIQIQDPTQFMREASSLLMKKRNLHWTLSRFSVDRGRAWRRTGSTDGSPPSKANQDCQTPSRNGPRPTSPSPLYALGENGNGKRNLPRRGVGATIGVEGGVHEQRCKTGLLCCSPLLPWYANKLCAWWSIPLSIHRKITSLRPSAKLPKQTPCKMPVPYSWQSYTTTSDALHQCKRFSAPLLHSLPCATATSTTLPQKNQHHHRQDGEMGWFCVNQSVPMCATTKQHEWWAPKQNIWFIVCIFLLLLLLLCPLHCSFPCCFNRPHS